jgi:tetratricopeptide (TPR) repeat protein
MGAATSDDFRDQYARTRARGDDAGKTKNLGTPGRQARRSVAPRARREADAGSFFFEARHDQALKAENALRAADFERAIQIYRDAAKAQPTNPLIRMKLGILLRDRGRWSDALQQFEAALGSDRGRLNSLNFASGYRRSYR